MNSTYFVINDLNMALQNDWDEIEGPMEWNDAGYESGYYSEGD